MPRPRPAASASRDRSRALAHALRNAVATLLNASRLIAESTDAAAIAEGRAALAQASGEIKTIVDALVGPVRPTAARKRASPTVARRVLIVDDDRPAAGAMQRLLARRGHEIEVVASGNDAIGAALASRPHAVLLDIALPDVDGYAVARRLRQERALDRTLIVATTGYTGADDLRRARRAGFDAHLPKPIDLDALLGLLARGRT
jgi:two-component system CheB/CheR fusion protein